LPSMACRPLMETTSFLPSKGTTMRSREHRAHFRLSQTRLACLPSPSTTAMIDRYPFKKTPDSGASSSMSKKKPPPKKTRNQPYMNFEVAQALFDQNQSVGVRKSTSVAACSSTREGCRFLRCYAVAGSGAMNLPLPGHPATGPGLRHGPRVVGHADVRVVPEAPDDPQV
jgi:hypothetical protein